MSRRSTRLLAVLALLVTGGLGAAPTAAAHTDLVSSTPAAGAEVERPPQAVALTFTDVVVGEFASLSLAVDGGAARPLTITGGDRESDTVTARLPTEAAAGTWSVGYRVTSADGHPIQGAVAFEVTAPPSPAATPVSPPEATAPGPVADATPAAAPVTAVPASGAGAGAGALPVLAAGFLMVLLIGLYVVRGSRRRDAEDGS